MSDIEEFSGAALIEGSLGGRKVHFFARDLAGIGSVFEYEGTSRIFRRSDSGCLILTTSGSAVSMIVPPFSQTAFPIPSRISVAQMGAGQVTFVAGSGVTILSPETLKLSKQYAAATLVSLDTDVWLLAGYLATS